MKWLPIIVVLIFMGCGMKATITDPDGLVWTVTGPKKSIVSLKRGDTEVMVDSKKVSFWEDIVKVLILAPK